MLSLSFPPAGIGPLAFLGLIPLLWITRDVRPARGALLGLTFGFTYFGALLAWVIQLTVLGWAALSLVSAGSFAVLALLTPIVWREDRPGRSAVGWAALLVALEYVRAMWPLGGFTWGGLGYSQTGNGFLLPLATITGVWGVTFVVALVNAFVLQALEWAPLRRAAAAGALGLALGAVLLPALAPIHAPNGRPVNVAIVQGNDVETRLDGATRAELIAEKHATLHLRLRDDPPDLAVWPEDAVDLDPTRYAATRDLVQPAIRAVGAPTLVGIVAGEQDGRHRIYNQSLLYDGRGHVVGRYTKTHLVPFGEFVPWRRELSFISALRQIPYDFSPGSRHTLLRVNGLTFANVICFENTFPSLDRRLVRRGAGFLVVSTNNASYGRTAASRQHLAMSQMRAVENGRWVVHAAVSGISAFIDPHGRAHQTTGLYERTIDRFSIRTSGATTVYMRWGDWFPWVALAVALAVLLAVPRRRERRGIRALPADARALVIIPTYDERSTIEAVIERVLAAERRADVLVVDDGSPDGTGDLVASIAEGNRRVRLLRREAKSGLAAAYRAGFEQAIRDGYDLVIEMDADLSHSPEELPSLLEGAMDHHLAIGSRYVRGGSVTNWGILRRLLSRGGNLYARAILGVPINDATSGYRVYRGEVLEELLRGGIHADGYGFQIELAYRAWRWGFRVTERPITFREREHGQSKISRRIVAEALVLVTLWGLRDRLMPWRARRDAARESSANPRADGADEDRTPVAPAREPVGPTTGLRRS